MTGMWHLEAVLQGLASNGCPLVLPGSGTREHDGGGGHVARMKVKIKRKQMDVQEDWACILRDHFVWSDASLLKFRT
jgi:hypothetical protein